MTTTANVAKPANLYTETPHIEGNGIRTADVLFWLGLPGEFERVQRLFTLSARRGGAVDPSASATDMMDVLLHRDYDAGSRGNAIMSIEHAVRSAMAWVRNANYRPGCASPTNAPTAPQWGRGCALGTDAPEMRPMARNYLARPQRSICHASPSVLASILEVAPRLRTELLGVSGEDEQPTGKTVAIPGGKTWAKLDYRKRSSVNRPRVYAPCTVKE